MIRFNQNNDNVQFVSIVLHGGEDTSTVFERLSHVISGLSLFAKDCEEILLDIPDGGCGFSLNQLRAAIEPIAKAKVAIVTVDLDEPSQRLTG